VKEMSFKSGVKGGGSDRWWERRWWLWWGDIRSMRWARRTVNRLRLTEWRRKLIPQVFLTQSARKEFLPNRNSELFHWSLLKNTLVIVMRVYMRIAVRYSVRLVLYHYCCKGRYCINIHLKCQGNARQCDDVWSG